MSGIYFGLIVLLLLGMVLTHIVPASQLTELDLNRRTQG